MADDKLRATPAARKLADDLGINLYDVSGSGANGRVHKEDVETYKDTNVVRISPLAKRIALEHNKVSHYLELLPPSRFEPVT